MSLQSRYRIVADAVDRKEHTVGAADQAWHQPGAVLDAAVMMKEAAAGALGHRLEPGNLVSPASHVEERKTGQHDRLCRAVMIRLEKRSQLPVNVIELPPAGLIFDLAFPQRLCLLPESC